MEERQVPDWMKLPVVLQHRFFEEAEKEAKRCKERMLKLVERLLWLREHLRFEPIPKSEEWRKWRVAVVDGSNSPLTSERLGSRYGAYCAGFMIFEGDEPVDEGYRSGSFSQDQLGSQDTAQKLLSLLRIRLERELAIKCIEDEDVDLVIIDGSFFGFKRDAYHINNELVDYEKYTYGKDLTKEVVDLTLKLLRFNTVGVIKRSRLAVIDGWLIRKYGSLKYTLKLNDKYILSSLMKPAEWFSYGWLVEDVKEIHYYETFRDRVIARKASLMSEDIKVDDEFERAKKRSDDFIRKSLGAEPEKVLCTARYFARCSPAASPFEIEAHKDVNVEPVLSYFLSFHNPATGLPWPIDLIDANASLPRGFTKEFVEEIEARLMRDHEVSDKLALLQHFSYLNPQKEED